MGLSFSNTIILLLCITALTLHAQPDHAAIARTLAHMNRHPFRKVDGLHYSLLPLFTYYAQENVRGRIPMPEWELVQGAVTQAKVSDGGLLVSRSSKTFHLKNYPEGAALADGARISGYAKAVGNFTYTDAFRVKRTVPAFDYGEPYTPDFSSTKTVSTNSTPPVHRPIVIPTQPTARTLRRVP